MISIFAACTAERFFRVDRAQEHLHYLTDISNEITYILDQELPTLPQTPEDETNLAPAGLYNKRNANFSSGSSDNLERESHENTPSSPCKNQKFFNRSVSGPGSSVTSDSGLDSNSRKCMCLHCAISEWNRQISLDYPFHLQAHRNLKAR